MISFSADIVHVKKRVDMYDWLSENIGDDDFRWTWYVNDVELFFENDSDEVMFKLRFGL